MNDDNHWLENPRMIRDSTGAMRSADGSLSRVRAQRFRRPEFDREVFSVMVRWGGSNCGRLKKAARLGLAMRGYCALAEELGSRLLPRAILSEDLD
ncbi:hypothetical protein [Rhizobium sp.]|uniref:hypothetical protein n=1 Tax=Rhizobium sp. TaxID=391 RepID=UPI0034C5D720